jgi:hypothetical protein
MPHTDDLHPALRNLQNPTKTPTTDQLWSHLRTREAVSAAEAFTDAELPGPAGLSGYLVRHFPESVFEESFRKTVGFMLAEIMRTLGYEIHERDKQINVPGIFSTGALYRRVGTEMRDRSQRINRAQRNAWAQARIDLT